MSGETARETACGAASARAVITVTAQNVPPERQAAVTAHIEEWLTRWLPTVRLADSETGIDYTLTATGELANSHASSHGDAEIARLRAEVERLKDGILQQAARLVRMPIEDEADSDAVKAVARALEMIRAPGKPAPWEVTTNGR